MPDELTRLAARTPEPPAAAGNAADDAVQAVGIGPGAREYLLAAAERHIRTADVVVGFESVVDYVADLPTGDVLTCGYDDQHATLDRFAERVAAGEDGTAVLMGDPNHSGYQFLGRVEDAVDTPVRVVPGISSIQVAASRARTPIEDSRFVTLHRRGTLDEERATLRQAVGEDHLLVIPRPYDWMPGDVAGDLIDHGADPGLDALVFEHLTHEAERRHDTTLGDLAGHAGGDGPDDSPFSDLSILVVRAE
ncbi:cobalt-precorrin-7 (C(5))-methyltransferase [Halococcoides cellulosivorans]|uniref:Cobalt-precorrin-7 (C(5))-methyltransferase n=1 Tax=Halococcoides cellulosivorans TaxID=1679096 RepID=A0A2R4WZL2_9EURY|nr:cobalt-precorrin-7 (C(5))-methyltransferase [Halococcoides cellulosivorans]AWB26983.1 cobalt-precorrin-7 (C(5))-methyltransferase [Halococcoides cellulosivorans]